MKAELTDDEKEVFAQCHGDCRICLYEGGCYLEEKLKRGVTHDLSRPYRNAGPFSYPTLTKVRSTRVTSSLGSIP